MIIGVYGIFGFTFRAISSMIFPMMKAEIKSERREDLEYIKYLYSLGKLTCKDLLRDIEGLENGSTANPFESLKVLDRCLKIKEVADLLNCSTAHVHHLANAGLLVRVFSKLNAAGSKSPRACGISALSLNQYMEAAKRQIPA